MIFDLICAITILGLAIKGLKDIFSNKIVLLISLIIAFYFSSFLTPLYMKYIKITIHLPANIVSFILTFVFSYFLLVLPNFLLRVVLGGGIIIIVYALLINFLPNDYKILILKDSLVYSFLDPVVKFILNLFHFFKFLKIIK